MTSRHPSAADALRAAIALLAVVFLAAACSHGANDDNATKGRGHTMSADAMQTKIIDATRQVVRQTGLKPQRAALTFDSCNDQGDGPYQAFLSSGFAGSTIDLAESDQVVDGWVTKLAAQGWTVGHPTTGTNGRYLSRDGLTVALFPHREPQPSPSPTFTVTSGCVLGDDVTSTAAFRTGVDVLSQVA